MSEAEGALADILDRLDVVGIDDEGNRHTQYQDAAAILAALSADGWRVERVEPVPESFSINLTPQEAWRGGYVAGRRAALGGPDATD